MKLKVSYVLGKTLPRDWKGGHNQIRNLNFWEGRFHKCSKKCGFVLKDRRQVKGNLIVSKVNVVALNCTLASEKSVCGHVPEWTTTKREFSGPDLMIVPKSCFLW